MIDLLNLGQKKKRRVLKKTYANSRRLQEIVSILIKYELTDYIKLLRLDKSVKMFRHLVARQTVISNRKHNRWELFRMAIEELGPTFIKFGQLLSNRTDLVPPSLIKELVKLQDFVPSFTEEKLRKVLRKELKKPLDKLFIDFQMKPVASASIAQVHRAVLPTGQEVAVKVQRPGIERQIDTDLEILSAIARRIEKYIPSTRYLDPCGLVEEFRVQLKIELNFKRELLHIQKFENIFKGKSDKIRVPETYADYCTRRVLTMDFIEGTKVSVLKDQHAMSYDAKLVAQRIADLMMEQMFIHGFFHADPHPGNIFIQEHNVVCFLDFGMMGRVRPKEKEALTFMLLGMVNRDAEKVTKALLQITRRTVPINLEELEVRVYDLLEEYIDLSLEDFDIGAMFMDLVTLLRNYGLIIPSNLLLLIKAIIAVEGIGLYLYPKFNLIRLFKPFSRRLIMEQFQPKRVVNELYELGLSYKALAEDFPKDMREILRQTRKGQLKMSFRIIGMESVRRTIDRVGYRLIYGLVLAALLVSSSLVIQADIPPRFREIPIIGLAGFAVAGLLGIGFLISLMASFFRK
jgi:ubiquinone biosynthesis protein